jgi:hypothetical protein
LVNLKIKKMDFDGFVSMIEGLGTGEKNTALEMRTLLTHLIQNIYIPGDVKMVICTQEELITDYDETGIGKGKRAGWAKLNGLGGRLPFGGRVPIGQSDAYPIIGTRGGFEKHKLTIAEMPAHGHDIKVNSGSGGSINGAEDAVSSGTTISTSLTGGGEPHNIMQPFVVVLYLVKLE